MDRHLLPNEIDLLLDGEVGFGTSPLKMHVRRCAECRAELEDARTLVRALEHLPHYAPSPLFEQRVMAQVQVFEPLHVALLDVARGWMPRSRPARMLAGLGLGVTAVALTVFCLWLVTRIDIVIFAADLALDRVRQVVMGAIFSTVGSAFGEPALHALRAAGPWGMVAALLALLAATAAVAGLLRVLAATPRGR